MKPLAPVLLVLLLVTLMPAPTRAVLWQSGLPIISSSTVTVTLGFDLNAQNYIAGSIGTSSVIIDGFNLTISPTYGVFTATMSVWNPTADSGTLVGLTEATDTVAGDRISISLSSVSGGNLYQLTVGGSSVGTTYANGGVVSFSFTSGGSPSSTTVDLGVPQGGGEPLPGLPSLPSTPWGNWPYVVLLAGGLALALYGATRRDSRRP